MALKIRLARSGAKKRPFYNLVVAEATSPRDGKFVEKIGRYDPMLPKTDDARVVINVERAKYWLSVGAKPTERVIKFFSEVELANAVAVPEQSKQHLPKKKAQEKLNAIKAKEEAAKSAVASEEKAAESEASAE